MKKRFLISISIIVIGIFIGSATVWAQFTDQGINNSHRTFLGMAEYNGKLYMAWRGVGSDKNQIFYKTFSDMTWSGTSKIQGATSSHGPSMIVYKGQLYTFWKGANDSNIYCIVHDGMTWSGVSKIPVTPVPKTDNGVALAVYEGKLFIAWDGVGSNMYWATFDGSKWSAQTKVIKDETDRLPALAVYNNKLYMIWKGKSETIYWATYSNGGWTEQRKIPAQGTHSNPVVTVIDNKLMIFYIGKSSYDYGALVQQMITDALAGLGQISGSANIASDITKLVLWIKEQVSGDKANAYIAYGWNTSKHEQDTNEKHDGHVYFTYLYYNDRTWTPQQWLAGNVSLGNLSVARYRDDLYFGFANFYNTYYDADSCKPNTVRKLTVNYMRQMGLLLPVDKSNYRIVSKKSGKALDVIDGSKDNQALVQQWSKNDTDQQKWKLEMKGDGYYRIVSRKSGKVLDVRGGSTNNSALIQQYDWADVDQQKWKLEYVDNDYCRIISKKSGKVLDVMGGGINNGVLIQQYEWNGTDAQLWKIEKM